MEIIKTIKSCFRISAHAEFQTPFFKNYIKTIKQPFRHIRTRKKKITQITVVKKKRRVKT
jgi:hypothetical protein